MRRDAVRRDAVRRRALTILACGAVLACAGPGEDGAESADSSESDSSVTGAPGDGDPGDGDPGDGDPDSGDGDGDPDPGDLGCDPEAFTHAPRPRTVDDLEAVAIDILDLDATLDFDVDGASATASVRMSFQVGPHPGNPLFDLRQSVDALSLDGQAIDTSLLDHHDFGLGWHAGFSILALELEACSVHTLELDYDLLIPDALEAGGLEFHGDPARLRFDLWMSDLSPGRYLESWLPANMPWDRHPIHLGLSLADAGEAHELITNGVVEVLAEHDWQIEFPATTSALAPMILVVPSSTVDVATGIHTTASGQEIAYSLWVDVSLASPPSIYLPGMLDDLDTFVRSLGTYPYPTVTAYLFDSPRSMEYAGATTSSPDALSHELFHSFWARGLEPATYADGWIDEAWDMFNTQPGVALIPTPIDWDAPTVELFNPHPFARVTPAASYSAGRIVFAGLADLMGVVALRDAMAALFAQGSVPRSISTAELERHLYCESGELAEVRQAFHRFVYGLDDQAPPPPSGYCP